MRIEIYTYLVLTVYLISYHHASSNKLIDVSSRLVVESFQNVLIDINTIKVRVNVSLTSFINYNDEFIVKLSDNDKVAEHLKTNVLTDLTDSFLSNCVEILDSRKLRHSFIKNKSLSLTHQTEMANQMCYSKVEFLDLSSSKLSQFPAKITNNWFPNLRRLNASNNLIKNITSHSDFLTMLSRFTLEQLDLSSNLLTNLDEEVFKSLKSLKYLNLANNQIRNINLFAFSFDQHNLIELNLFNNQITDTCMEFLLFSSLTNLKYLNLNANRLTTLSNHLLYNLYSLEKILLSHNNMTSFDLFRLNKNNEHLKVIDLSFNLNLVVADVPSDNLSDDNDEDMSSQNELEAIKFINNVEHLNLAGIDLSSVNMNTFLDALFDRFHNLRILNLSSTRTKSLWSQKWPLSKIEIVDLSHNLIKDGQFDCDQFNFGQVTSNAPKSLKKIILNNNYLKDFKQLIDNCSPLLNDNVSTSLLIDLRYNLFESVDSISSSLDNKQCQNILNNSRSSLLLNGNPLICNCDSHTWWTNILSTTSAYFHVNKAYCLQIKDYDQLTCSSMSPFQMDKNVNTNNKYITFQSKQLVKTISNSNFWASALKFRPIRSSLIKAKLICPYKYSCSPNECECCGFKACDCSFSCPATCKCTRNFEHTYDMVNCTGVNLNTIPTFLPMLTTDVHLNANNLKRVMPHQFFGRFRIKNLDLSHNQLGFIEENSFNGLTQLKLLKLSKNNLQILLGYEFKDLYQLEELLLDHNQIQFISNLTFSYLINLRYLDLKYNNLRHHLDVKLYFLFNPNLINLTVDTIEDVKSKSLTSFKHNTNILRHSTTQMRKNSNQVITNHSESFSNLIFKLSESTFTIEMIKCVFEKFKQAANANSLDLSQSSSDSNHLKFILVENFKNFRYLCVDTKKNLLANNFLPFKSSNEKIQRENEIIDDEKLNAKSSFIVLNYSTIGWCLITLVLIIIGLSILFSYLILKFQKTKDKLENRLKNSNSGDCLKQTRSFLKSMRKKFSKFLNRIANKPSQQMTIEQEKSAAMAAAATAIIAAEQLKYQPMTRNEKEIDGEQHQQKLNLIKYDDEELYKECSTRSSSSIEMEKKEVYFFQNKSFAERHYLFKLNQNETNNTGRIYGRVNRSLSKAIRKNIYLNRNQDMLHGSKHAVKDETSSTLNQYNNDKVDNIYSSITVLR